MTESDLEAAMAFYIRALKLPVPVREHVFHPTRGWRFDFAWPDRMVALECEGGVFVGGRHVQGEAFTKDCEKYSEAAVLGWRVIRATADQIKSGQASAWLERALVLEDVSA